MQALILYFVALPIAFVIDLLWIGLIANKFYRTSLGDLFAPQVNWLPAALFYLIYVGVLVVLVLVPAIEAHSFMRALIFGALLGLAAYAAYDLTNLAVIRNWPVFMSLVDMAWGVFMTAFVSGSTYLIATRFLGM